MPEYDEFADVYAAWTASTPVAEPVVAYYADLYVGTPGRVVELGVGDGRIAVEALKRGKPVIGLDASERMLRACAARSRQAGVGDRLTLMHGDMRDFRLHAPAELIAIPFHTLVEIPDLAGKRQALRCAYDQLVPGGRLVFDLFVFDRELALKYDNVPHLEGDYTDEDTGGAKLFWACTLHDFDDQTMRVIAWTDDVGPDGTLVGRKYQRFESSWLEPDQVRTLLAEAGFEVVSLHGDFDGSSFDDDSTLMVWTARKPG